MPNQPPLPSALLINHFSNDNIEMQLSISEDLLKTSLFTKEKLDLTAMFHVNASTNENIEESFHHFIEDILDD
jgi:hypothetical protein